MKIRARLFNRRIWRWRWNKLRYKLNPDPEYEAWLAKEKAEVEALLSGLPDHIESCFVGQNPNWNNCPANGTLHGEKNDEHWWSGWPGAFCLKCGAGDLMESCIGHVCECQCHEEFWKSYDESMRKESDALS